MSVGLSNDPIVVSAPAAPFATFTSSTIAAPRPSDEKPETGPFSSSNAWLVLTRNTSRTTLPPAILIGPSTELGTVTVAVVVGFVPPMLASSLYRPSLERITSPNQRRSGS